MVMDRDIRFLWVIVNLVPTHRLWKSHRNHTVNFPSDCLSLIEDEMAGRHHRLDGHEFGSTPGVDDGQGGLVCCNSRGHKESDTTERLNWTELEHSLALPFFGIGMKTDLFWSCGHCCIFQICWHISAALSKHRLLGFEIPQLKFHHLQ